MATVIYSMGAEHLINEVNGINGVNGANEINEINGANEVNEVHGAKFVYGRPLELCLALLLRT